MANQLGRGMDTAAWRFRAASWTYLGVRGAWRARDGNHRPAVTSCLMDVLGRLGGPRKHAHKSYKPYKSMPAIQERFMVEGCQKNSPPPLNNEFPPLPRLGLGLRVLGGVRVVFLGGGD